MIILIINDIGITVFELKNDAPVFVYMAHFPEKTLETQWPITAIEVLMKVLERRNNEGRQTWQNPGSVERSQKSDKKGNTDKTRDYGVQKHTDLKVQGLLSVVVHKFILLLICGPEYQWENEISKGDKVL